MSEKDQESIAAEIAHRVLQQLGSADPESASLVSQEIAAALGNHQSEPATTAAPPSHLLSPYPERIVITANGRNRSGVVARLATVIDEFRGDIRDISQTIVGDYFTMIFVADISGATSEGAHFDQLKFRLSQIGEELGVHVVAIHDDILTAMHSV
jgi:ACT domain-containing protein